MVRGAGIETPAGFHRRCVKGTLLALTSKQQWRQRMAHSVFYKAVCKKGKTTPACVKAQRHALVSWPEEERGMGGRASLLFWAPEMEVNTQTCAAGTADFSEYGGKLPPAVVWHLAVR
jgi:hypothetical protein